MTLARTFPLVVLAALAGFGPAEAQRGDQLGRPYGEVIKGSEVGTGVFTIYFKHDSIYLALTPKQLERDYLLVTQISQGIGDLGLDGGTSLRSDLVRFHREGDTLYYGFTVYDPVLAEPWEVKPRALQLDKSNGPYNEEPPCVMNPRPMVSRERG